MTAISEIRCPNCLAPVDPHAARAALAACRYCGTSLDVRRDRGALMLAADFTTLDMPGWSTGLKNHLSITPGPPPELLAQLPVGPNAWNVLRSAAPFDDFEVSVTMRLLWGDRTNTRAGLFLRYSPRGIYSVEISTQQTFSVSFWRPGSGKTERLVPWAQSEAIRGNPGEPNELRVRFVGDRLRVMMNDTTIASLRDGSESHGNIYLMAQSTKAPMAVAFSALEVREPSPGQSEAGAPAAPIGETCSLVLISINPHHKIKVIKVVREQLKVGLAEAKTLVESTPQLLKSNLPREEARTLQKALEEAGGLVELK